LLLRLANSSILCFSGALGVLIWARTKKLSKPMAEWWSVGSAPRRYTCTARAMQALMEDVRGGVILEPVFVVHTLTLSLCKQKPMQFLNAFCFFMEELLCWPRIYTYASLLFVLLHTFHKPVSFL
jgi:hypothetical protein